MCLGCFTRAPAQDKNDTTLLGRFRRVAYIEDFYEILSRIHSVERCHMGYKKTLAEVMWISQVHYTQYVYALQILFRCLQAMIVFRDQ